MFFNFKKNKNNNQKINCNKYEKALEDADNAWQMIKEATKKSNTSALDQAIKNYSKAMKSIINIWPKVVDELGIKIIGSSTDIAYSTGYIEATDEYNLPKEIGYLRGDHVASKTLYKASQWIPFK